LPWGAKKREKQEKKKKRSHHEINPEKIPGATTIFSEGGSVGRNAGGGKGK